MKRSTVEKIMKWFCVFLGITVSPICSACACAMALAGTPYESYTTTFFWVSTPIVAVIFTGLLLVVNARSRSIFSSEQSSAPRSAQRQKVTRVIVKRKK